MTTNWVKTLAYCGSPDPEWRDKVQTFRCASDHRVDHDADPPADAGGGGEGIEKNKFWV